VLLRLLHINLAAVVWTNCLLIILFLRNLGTLVIEKTIVLACSSLNHVCRWLLLLR